ncbi:MAG: hypothetical protein R3349_10885, partial [Geminicoccaceae bacterium]|nr:hypothetical protein [Geminicoccaceae bacterium]
MINEGGYSPLYAPFCALAALEALSGRASSVKDPMVERYVLLPGQELKPHEDAVLARAESLLVGINR